MALLLASFVHRRTRPNARPIVSRSWMDRGSIAGGQGSNAGGQGHYCKGAGAVDGQCCGWAVALMLINHQIGLFWVMQDFALRTLRPTDRHTLSYS